MTPDRAHRPAAGFWNQMRRLPPTFAYCRTAKNRTRPEESTYQAPFAAERQAGADRFPLELCGRSRITPRHLYVERNETIARVAHQQNDLCTTKLLLRDQILAANPVPKIAFRPMLE